MSARNIALMKSSTAHILLYFVSLVALFASAAAAEEREDAANEERFALDPMVISAQGYGVPLSKVPGGAAVVEEDEISKSQPLDVPQALERIPGVSKASDSLWSSEVNIRGRTRESVVYLIDGARLNTQTDINAQYGLLDPAEIERIEVLKGPISSLYGSGSVGGVVNVITRSGRFSETEEFLGAAQSGASLNPDGAVHSARLNYNSPNWYFYGGQTYRNLGSFEDGESRLMQNSQFEDEQSTLKSGFKIDDCNRLDAQVQFFRGWDVGIPGAGTAPLPATADVTYPVIRRDLWSLGYTHTPASGALRESKTLVYYQTIDRRVQLDKFPAVSPISLVKPRADHDTLGSSWSNIIEVGAHTITAGADLWQRSLDSSRERRLRNGASVKDIPLPDSSYLSSGLFVEENYEASESLTLNAGGRVDAIRVENDKTEIWEDREENDSSWNAHTGAVLKLTGGLNWFGVLARGYRAATLEERYSYLELGSGRVKYGNPDLNPERSVFYETGLRHVGEGFSFEVSGFVNNLDDLISDKVVDETTIVSSNIAEARIWGLESELKWFLSPSWSIYGNIASIRGKDTEEDTYIPDIPPLSGLVGVQYDSASGLWGFVETRLTRKQDKAPEGVLPAPGWATVNVSIGYDFMLRGLEQRVLIAAENIFDKSYRNYLTTSRGFDFNEPGQSLRVSYALRF